MLSDPKHDRKHVIELWKQSITSFKLPINQFRDYFGEHITMYFCWMEFFTLWLVAPAIIGVSMSLFRPVGITVEDSLLVPFFSLFVVLWGILFVRFWDRRCASISYDWDTLQMDQCEEPNPNFKGSDRKNPHTGKMEKYYSSTNRLFHYIISTVVTSGMLCVAFSLMVCSLNLQGYIHDESRFKINCLFALSRPGSIFDPNGPIYLSLLPVIIHSTVILGLNMGCN